MSYSKEEIQAELIRREVQKRGLAKKDQNWETAGGQVIDPKEEPSTLVDSLKVDMDKGVEKTWDRIGANVQAGYTGILSLGSSLVKVADKIGMAPKGSAEKAQSAFDEASKIYDQGEYPETAVTNFLAPGLLPGSLPIKLGSKLIGMAGSKLGGPLLKKAGQYIGSAIGGATTGAVYGGLSNTAGNSPYDVWNEQGAKTGLLLGAPLGAAGQFTSNYGKHTANYQVAKEELKAAGYKGPTLSRDYGDEVIGQIKSNWMDNIVATGIRDEQLQAITPAIKQLLGSFTDVSQAQSSEKLGNIITGVNKKLEKESSIKWQNLYEDSSKQGITKINLDLTDASTKDFLKKYGSNLSKDDKKALQTLAGNIDVKTSNILDSSGKPIAQSTDLLKTKQLDFKQLNEIKGQIWDMSETFGKLKDVQGKNMSADLRNLYWDITSDIGNTLKSNPKLAEAFTDARAFTQGVKSIFNVKQNRKLMNAIKDFNETTGQFKTFVNSVMKPETAKRANYYNQALGQEYTDEVSKLAFNKIFLNSVNKDTQDLELGKFFAGVKESDAKGLLNNSTVKSLDVLNKHFDKIMSVQQGAKNSLAKEASQAIGIAKGSAVVGGYMAGGLPGGLAATAGVVLGPAFLGYISKSSPLKNLLIGASNAWGKNPKLTEHIMDIVGKKMSQIGVTMSATENGIKLDKKDKK